MYTLTKKDHKEFTAARAAFRAASAEYSRRCELAEAADERLESLLIDGGTDEEIDAAALACAEIIGTSLDDLIAARDSFLNTTNRVMRKSKEWRAVAGEADAAWQIVMGNPAAKEKVLDLALRLQL